MAGAGLAPRHGFNLYNSRVSTLFSYIATLCPPPKSLWKSELGWFTRIGHLPGGPAPFEAFINIDQLGFGMIRSATITAWSAHIASALSDRLPWRPLLNLHKQEIEDHIPLALMVRNAGSPAGWAALPFAQFLANITVSEFRAPRKLAKALCAGMSAAINHNDMSSKILSQYFKAALSWSFIDYFGGKLAMLFDVAPLLYGASSVCDPTTLIAATMRLGPQHVFHVLKAVAGAVPTARRNLHARTPCRHGCTDEAAAEDSWPHLVRCPAIAAAFEGIIDIPFSDPHLAPAALVGLGLVPDPLFLSLVVLLFNTTAVSRTSVLTVAGRRELRLIGRALVLKHAPRRLLPGGA